MGDEFRQIRAGEAVLAGNPIVSTKRNNVLTQLAKERLGGQLPSRGAIPDSNYRDGVVKTCTASTWNNAGNEMTVGEIEIWPFDTDNKIDRNGTTIKIPQRAPHAAVEGSYILWHRRTALVLMCKKFPGWA